MSGEIAALVSGLISAIAMLILGLLKYRSDARNAKVRMAEIEVANKSTMQLSLDQALKSVTSLGNQIDSMRDRMKAADEVHTAERSAANQKALDQQNEIDELKDLVRDQADQIRQLVIESEKATTARTAEQTALNAKVEAQAKEISRLTASETELRALNAEKDKRIERLEGIIVERDEQLAALMKNSDERVARLETIISKRDEALAALTTRVTTLEGENNRLAREEKHWAEERALWKAERETWQHERDALIGEREALQVQIGEMRVEIDTLKRHGTGPLPSLEEVMDAQPEAGEEQTETQDNGEEKPDGTQ